MIVCLVKNWFFAAKLRNLPGITKFRIYHFARVMEKKELRRQIKTLKAQYSLDEKKELSRLVWRQLESHALFRDARIVLLYWSMDDEVYTHDYVLKWADSKKILLPCVKGDVLELREFRDMESLRPGESFGIPEPVGELFTDYASIDAIVVPGVAFDLMGNRLGRGRGYYDRILKETDAAAKIGICFDFQLLPEVPVNALDVPMDLVVSATRIISPHS